MDVENAYSPILFGLAKKTSAMGVVMALLQALSARPDVLSPKICRELEVLQDSMPSFPCDKAQSIIEQQIKKPVSQLFKEFPKKPIAAASLGQVSSHFSAV